MSQFGSNSEVGGRNREVRFSLDNGLWADIAPLPFGAKTGSGFTLGAKAGRVFPISFRRNVRPTIVAGPWTHKLPGGRLARSAMHCRLNRSTQRFIFKGKMECGDGSGVRRGFTMAENTELWDRCDIGSARKNLVHIQFITLSAWGSVGRKDDPNKARTSTINKPAPQNTATVSRMSKSGGIEGIVFEKAFAVACMAVPFVWRG
jgi:hypothetical protein